MKRKAFSAAIMAVFVSAALWAISSAKMEVPLKAQETTVTSGSLTVLAHSADPCWSSSKGNLCIPRNGQCPVCGKMAEAFRPACQYTLEDLNKTRYSDGSLWFLHSIHDKPKLGDPCITRIVRCKRCNAAFWQDAEPDK